MIFCIFFFMYLNRKLVDDVFPDIDSKSWSYGIANVTCQLQIA
jgi:hypothetical protein